MEDPQQSSICLVTGLVSETTSPPPPLCIPPLPSESQTAENPAAKRGPVSAGLRPLLERPPLIYRPSQQFPRSLDPIAEDPVDNLESDSIATISEEESFFRAITLGSDDETTCAPHYARVSKHVIIPANSMRFLQADVPTIKGEEWVVSKSFSSRPSREWIIPNGLLKAFGKKLYLPVLNLTNKALKWAKGSVLAPVEKLTGPVTFLEENSTLCAATEVFPPPLPEDVKHNISVGDKLTDGQREQLLVSWIGFLTVLLAVKWKMPPTG